ncbi:hypothetical protein GJW-30_1_00585 [Variibacter gotjawalensis]|uniref:DUF5666 domain-containing protein n=1 Tax=Variibacter gotjawalensis TaxID=1333996 RepID=A0A0S3PQ55_9BRAD|nr:hypothetical protein [Variibacter gotjawalensis]NIK48371.1 hypothetical protein [Variibacter gotjawalensis]RZS50238.1 hypothetical protein EV661_2694 [Variibacter gotjawalensis]BAT58071.1 hypothetical protein GJW-30_1_00585 [Variibacter gotjawalensis]
MKHALLLLAASLALTAPTFAQQGWDDYETKLITVSGAIIQSRYETPNAAIGVDTPEKMWTVVLAAPSRMTSRGVSADMISLGRSVIVQGYVSKTDKDEMRAERITVNGKTFEMR